MTVMQSLKQIYRIKTCDDHALWNFCSLTSYIIFGCNEAHIQQRNMSKLFLSTDIAVRVIVETYRKLTIPDSKVHGANKGPI